MTSPAKLELSDQPTIDTTNVDKKLTTATSNASHTVTPISPVSPCQFSNVSFSVSPPDPTMSLSLASLSSSNCKSPPLRRSSSTSHAINRNASRVIAGSGLGTPISNPVTPNITPPRSRCSIHNDEVNYIEKDRLLQQKLDLEDQQQHSDRKQKISTSSSSSPPPLYEQPVNFGIPLDPTLPFEEGVAKAFGFPNGFSLENLTELLKSLDPQQSFPSIESAISLLTGKEQQQQPNLTTTEEEEGGGDKQTEINLALQLISLVLKKAEVAVRKRRNTDPITYPT